MSAAVSSVHTGPTGLDWRPVAGRAPARCTLTVVLAGGRGSRLAGLTDQRAKPAMPFAGKLRLIDFPLSNCVNSGLRRIAVLTQYKAQSLIRHVEQAWGFLTRDLAEFVDVVPAQQQLGECWYAGTADALYQNLDLLREEAAERVLVLAGDHVYKMDYSVMLAEHLAARAEVTVACVEVPLAEAGAYGVMEVGADGRVLSFQEKPAPASALRCAPGRALASMGIYVFDTALLCRELSRDAADPASSHDFGRDLLPRLVHEGRVHAHRFETSCVNRPGGRPYWRDVGTVDAYWSAHMDLIQPTPELDLYDERWPILSRQPPLPPAKFVHDEDGCRGMALDSLVSGGCIVAGATVRRSVLFPGVRLAPGSLVEDSVLLPGATIGRRARVRRAVVDSRCALPDGFKVGDHAAEDAAHFHHTAGGITLITPAMLAAA